MEGGVQRGKSLKRETRNGGDFQQRPLWFIEYQIECDYTYRVLVFFGGKVDFSRFLGFGPCG